MFNSVDGTLGNNYNPEAEMVTMIAFFRIGWFADRPFRVYASNMANFRPITAYSVRH